MRHHKTRWLLLLLLLVPLLLVGLYAVSGLEFLPWAHYRSISAWSEEEVHYQVKVVPAPDSTYRVVVFAPKTSHQTGITWLGDSVQIGRYNDAFYRLRAEGDLFGFDTSIISVSGNRLIPHRAGTSPLYVRLPAGIDTLSVTVEATLAVYGESKAVR
jgi:hypothetical protein